jgi:hypothetical protein
MTAARTLTDADIAALRDLLRTHEDAVVDRVEARLKRQRPKAQRRTRTPELVASIAAESTPVDELAQARARSALARLR